MDRVSQVVDEADFKARYNEMLQQFKELKQRQKSNQARHRQLNEELYTYEKKNVDLMIKIKMIESELNGASEADIASLFEVQIKAKTDKIAQLEAKKLQQAQTAKRKNEQNQAIIAKLKNTIKEKELLLNQKEAEYNQTISATSELTTQIQSSPQESTDFEKKKHELEERLAQIQAELKEQTEKAESLKKQLNQTNQGNRSDESPDLEAKAKELQSLRAEQQANQRATIKELENQITSGAIVRQVAEKYEPLIKEAQSKRAAAMQQIQKLRETASQEEQEIVTLNRQIKQTSDKIKDFKKLKQEVERSNKQIAKLRKEEELQKGRIVNNSNKIHNTQQEISKLEAESNDLKNMLKAARQRNEALKKENSLAQSQLIELKSKINRNDPKQYETLKRQKQSLQNELNREKNRYEALRQLQKTYYPESALKDLKSNYEELRQKTLNLPTLQKENKKLKEQHVQVQRKIDELKQRDQQTIDELSAQSKELQIKIEDLQRTHASVSKTLNETNSKVASYTKHFPDHEEQKQRKKLEEKRQQDERNKQKRQKNKGSEEERLHERHKANKEKIDQEQMLGTSPETEDSPRVSSSTTQIKSNIQQYEYMGLVGLIVLAIVVYIFR